MSSKCALLFLTLCSGVAAQALQFSSELAHVQAGLGQESLATQFEFQNKGPKKVTITNVETSCGCTTGLPDRFDYEPGERGRISATVAVGRLEGKLSKTITVTTDEPDKNSYTLTIEADIPEVIFTPRYLVWSRPEIAQTKTVTVRVPPPARIELVKATDAKGLFRAKARATGDAVQIEVTPETKLTGISTELGLELRADNGVTLQRTLLLRVLPDPALVDPLQPKSVPANKR